MGKEQEFTGKEWDSEMGLNYFRSSPERNGILRWD